MKTIDEWVGIYKQAGDGEFELGPFIKRIQDDAILSTYDLVDAIVRNPKITKTEFLFELSKLYRTHKST